MDTLQLDSNRLNPEQERLPQQLLEKCAALSVRPNAIKDLVDSMGGMLVYLDPGILSQTILCLFTILSIQYK